MHNFSFWFVVLLTVFISGVPPWACSGLQRFGFFVLGFSLFSLSRVFGSSFFVCLLVRCFVLDGVQPYVASVSRFLIFVFFVFLVFLVPARPCPPCAKYGTAVPSARGHGGVPSARGNSEGIEIGAF